MDSAASSKLPWCSQLKRPRNHQPCQIDKIGAGCLPGATMYSSSWRLLLLIELRPWLRQKSFQTSEAKCHGPDIFGCEMKNLISLAVRAMRPCAHLQQIRGGRHPEQAGRLGLMILFDCAVIWSSVQRVLRHHQPSFWTGQLITADVAVLDDLL
jgi:hypothetical protein